MPGMILLALLAALPQETDDELIRRLDDESAEVRERSTEALIARGAAAVEALRGAARHPEAEVRARVQRILYRIEWDPTLNPLLTARYPELDRAFRGGEHSAVLDFLDRHPRRDLGFASLFEAYAIKLLDHPDVELRKRATSVLWHHDIGYTEVPRRPVAKLVGLIARWDPLTCRDDGREWLIGLVSTAHALASPLDRPVLAETRAAHPEAERALQLLQAAVGVESARAAVLETLESGPDWARQMALKIVEATRWEAARGATLKLLGDPGVGYFALRALGAIADPSCEKALLEHHRRQRAEPYGSSDLRPVARLRTRESTAFIQEAIRSGNPTHTWEDISAAGEAGLREAFDAAFEGIDDPKRGSHCAMGAAWLSDGRTVDRLLDRLARPRTEWGNLTPGVLVYVSEPHARRKVLRWFEKEGRTDARRGTFEAIISPPFLLPGDADVEGLIEKIARTPGDRLAAPAAIHLLRMRGKDAVGLAEDVVLASPDGTSDLLGRLSRYPSGRLVETAARLALLPESAEAALAYLERAGARRELERIVPQLKDDHRSVRAAAALLRTGGDGIGAFSRVQEAEGWWPYMDLVESDAPGVRDLLRRHVREERLTEWTLWSLKRWAHPEMIGAIKKAWEDWASERTPANPEEEIPMFSAVLGGPIAGHAALEALAATGDASLAPFFIECLKDSDAGVQHIAIRAIGRLRAQAAVPSLKQLVLSGVAETREVAIDALAEIGAPGTADFLKLHLRDNPHACPRALARLGADACEDVAALLQDGRHVAPIVGALDLMANREVYRKIDASLPPRASSDLADLPEIIEKITGVRSRLSPAVRARVRAVECDRGGADARTLRQAFVALEEQQDYFGGRVTHLVRDGAIEICSVEEALAHWARRFPR